MKNTRILIGISIIIVFIIVLVIQIPSEENSNSKSAASNDPESSDQTVDVAPEPVKEVPRSRMYTFDEATTTTLYNSSNNDVKRFCHDLGYESGYCSSSPNVCMKGLADYMEEGNKFCPKNGMLITYLCCKK